MSTLIKRNAARQNKYGYNVTRPAAVFTGISSTPIFTIVGGLVEITSIVGEITVGASGASNITLQSNPTTGTTAIFGAALAAGALEVGTILTISGTAADAIYGVSAGCAQAQARGVIVPTGAIEFGMSGAQTITVRWELFYIPIDLTAYVVVA